MRAKELFKTGLLSLLLLVNIACEKKAKSDFKLNQYEYAAGEQIDLINLSKKTKKQIWHIYDEKGALIDSSDQVNPAFRIQTMQSDGIYTISLYDDAEDLEWGVHTSKNFIVKIIRYQSHLYGSNAYEEFDAYSDGDYIGSSDPDGELYVYLPEGARLLKIVNKNGESASKTVLIEKSSSNSFYFY